MSLLPAVVPDIPESRGGVVAARLARKVAPLFGVPWPEGPFGGRTWVCDFARITLSEIARGAPLPSRGRSRELLADVAGPWELRERVAVTPAGGALPHEIANATLNRFGPDTRAAAVLTAVNCLLAPVTAAIKDGLPAVLSTPGGPLPEELRLAAWAGVVVEVFRSQPALIAAAIRARAIQRQLVAGWGLPLADDLAGLPLTRCEIGAAPESGAAPDRPATLDVADRTFGLLQVDPLDPEPSALADRRLREETVDLLLRRLLAAGTPHNASHMWLSERAPGQLVVEALLRPTPLIDQFVGQAVRDIRRTGDGRDGPLPAVPRPADLARHSPTARRVTVTALLAVLRHVQHSARGRDATRRAILPVLADTAALVRACFDRDDPAGALADCRLADMTLQTLRHDTSHDLAEPVAWLRRAVAHVHELTRAGVVDRGAAAEAVSSANVELNAVRWTRAADDPRLPDAVELHEELRRNWAAHRDVLEIRGPGSERRAGHHLHNHAAFLASPADTPDAEADLRAAVRMFTEVVLPARTEYAALTGVSAPLRTSLRVATRATTRLAAIAVARGDLTAARGHAEVGLTWIRLAVDGHPVTGAAPTEGLVRLALLAAPALLIALELGVPAAGADNRALVQRLLDTVGRWERTLDDPAHHARHPEVLALRARLDALDHPAVAGAVRG